MAGEHFCDQVARDAATEARAMIRSHEAVCTERWKQSSQASSRVENALAEIQAGINKRIGLMPASVISLLIGVIGFLAARAFPHP